MKVFLGSNPEVFTYTNANGQFTLKVDKLGIDSIFITGKTAVDTTYYNWHLPSINITQGENNITAFNDTTGIPMISRMWDTGLTAPQTGETNVSVDFLDYLCHVTRIINKFPTTPEWRQAMPRVRDEDLPIKVYMNRAIDPTNGWYADSSWVGLKASEAGRFRFVEVADSSEALMIIRYDNDMVGQGTNVGIDFDVSGPYISHWDIRIRGPLNGSVLQPKDAVAVMAHEPLHLAFCFGEHSLYMQDMFYGDPWSRMNRGYPLKLSEREEKAITTIFNLERNIKLLDYTR